MKRSLLVGMSLAGAVAAMSPAALAFADQPPSPPTTYYGTATGAVDGQGVVAVVTNGSNSESCGNGTVQTQAGFGLVYVVDVVTDAQKAGCGAPGRQVQFYFTPTGGAGGKLSTASSPWQQTGAPVSFNVTLGSALTERRAAPQVAKDGAY